MASQLFSYHSYRPQCFNSRSRLCTDRHSERIKNNIAFLYSVTFCRRKYFFCNSHSALCGIRNTLLVKSEGYNKTPVLFCKRHYSLYALCFAVHRIYHRLAVISPKCRLHSHRIGGIYLQRQCRHCLKLTHKTLESCLLVYFGQSGVHVKNMSAVALLTYCLGEDIVHISLSQCGFQLLFTGRIYALADKYGSLSELYSVSIRGHRRYIFLNNRRHAYTRRFFCKLTYIFGGRSATAARYANSLFNHIRHILGKLTGSHIVYGTAVFHLRKPCIGLKCHGNA